jgi:hypothetical protein
LRKECNLRVLRKAAFDWFAPGIIV